MAWRVLAAENTCPDFDNLCNGTRADCEEDEQCAEVFFWFTRYGGMAALLLVYEKEKHVAHCLKVFPVNSDFHQCVSARVSGPQGCSCTCPFILEMTRSDVMLRIIDGAGMVACCTDFCRLSNLRCVACNNLVS